MPKTLWYSPCLMNHIYATEGCLYFWNFIANTAAYASAPYFL